mmetsp:Transcript_40297/g.51931  ORF Transcript_40297/g.51931 Transcript_40297/m.51931 type:complete len:685 (-) Transcript_40297:355-2409(-)
MEVRRKIFSTKTSLQESYEGISCQEVPGKVVQWLKTNKNELLSGATVSLAQVPEAVAFSFVAGVEPSVGLTAAWIIGVFTALFGGRPGMISGATGSMAVVIVDLVSSYGVEYLFITIILTGLIQIALGLFRAGKTLRMISEPVMIGFCNGLAIIIFLAQFTSFKADVGASHRMMEATYDSGEGEFQGFQDHRRMNSFTVFTDGQSWVGGAELGWMMMHIILTMIITFSLPKFSKAIPSSLAGILFSLFVEHVIIRIGADAHTRTVGEVASVGGAFPIPVWLQSKYEMPPWNNETMAVCFEYAAILALIGLIESLMTMQLIDEITETVGSPNRECIGQGIANVITGIFGGMGGCAMIGQSMINVKSGGVKRLSSFMAGMALLIIILVAYPLINLIPIASLQGVMFMVVIHTFEWSSLKIVAVSCMPAWFRNHEKISTFKKIKRTDAVIIVAVTVVTLFSDLAVAVACGVVLSAIFFAWDSGFDIRAETLLIADDKSGTPTTKVYEIQGPLFYASVSNFLQLFDAPNDPAKVEIRLHASDIHDYSAIQALNKLGEKYGSAGKTVTIRRIREGCLKKMEKAQHLVRDEVVIDLEEEEELIPKTRTHHSVEQQLHLGDLHFASLSAGATTLIGQRPRLNSFDSIGNLRRRLPSFGDRGSASATPMSKEGDNSRRGEDDGNETNEEHKA